MQGYVEGSPKVILRLEGLLVLISGTFAYYKFGFNWPIYLWFFFLPDVSFAGYLVGPRAGSILYNFAHSYGVPIALSASSLVLDEKILLQASLIWASHIGFDRALGFGLKYSKGFGYTHLGLIGKVKGMQ